MEKQENSNVFGNIIFKKIVVAIIFVKSSANCTAELFAILPVAVKYPFNIADTDKKGRHTPNALREIIVRGFCNIFVPIKLAKTNIKDPESIPKKIPKQTHCLTEYFIPLWFKRAFSSATRRVQARLIPKIATVTAREYTDITKV